jgi:hypothetical protein
MGRMIFVLFLAFGAMPLHAEEMVVADNPILPGWYADPQIRLFGSTYWIFPTASCDFKEQTYLDAFSSKDLKNWKKHSNVLSTNAFPWAKGAVWAPDAIEKGGKYYADSKGGPKWLECPAQAKKNTGTLGYDVSYAYNVNCFGRTQAAPGQKYLKKPSWAIITNTPKIINALLNLKLSPILNAAK